MDGETKRTRPPALPAPEVRFAPDFPARCEALVARLARRRVGREGGGRAWALGPGEDFAGHRPYRPGEDLRRLDQDLLARLDRPYVRVERREAGERWTVRLDRSASMGVGPPGKLQRGAECAAAIARVGLALGARVRVVVSRGEADAPAARDLRRPGEWGALLAFLATTRAAGRGGLADLDALERPEGDRLFGVGDFLDADPSGWFVHRRGGRRLAGVQLLAPEELAPRLGPSVLVDPETGERAEVDVDDALRTEYERRLEARLEGWRRGAVRHGALHLVLGTERPFEDAVEALFAARGGAA